MNHLKLLLFLRIVILPLKCFAYDEVRITNILSSISWQEVRGRTNVVLHQDGVSCGDHGVTMGACQRLVDEHMLDRLPTIEELVEPETNWRIARLYLVLMYDQYGSWWEAVGRYHGGNKKRRNAYAKEVWRRL